MCNDSHDPRRRQLLGASASAALAAAVFPTRSVAQPIKTASRQLRVTQLVDTSADQQELARDYSAGLRLAFADLEKAGSRVPRLSTVECDGSAASVELALRAVGADASQVALVGSVGERLALTAVSTAKKIGLEIAHIGPWMADTRHDADEAVLPLFASRETQIAKALASLAGIGVGEVGLVYADERTGRSLHDGVASAAESARLRTRRYTVPAGQDAAAFARALPSSAPVILLFFGGAIELALFTQGLAARGMVRYVLCLADVSMSTLLQFGPGKGVPIILTQVVPNPQSDSLPIVRAYRQALRRFLDEEASPVGLAGYLAGRYAAHLLAGVEASATRAAVLAAVARHPALDLGGWRFDFAGKQRGSDFVAQTMLRSDGKLLG